MAEDDRLAFNIRCFVMNTVPNRIFLLGVILKCVSVIMRYGAAMNQNVRFAIDLDIDVQRQAVKIVENLLTDGFADMLDVLVGDITAVPVPQSKNVRVFRVVPVQHIEGIEHHILICAVSTLEQIYQKYGYHTLSRVLRLSIGTWEGDMNSFSANILNGITKLISVFGDQLNDEIFKEKVGAISVKQLVRTAKERHAGSMGYAEAMLIEYNGKKKNPAQRLSMNKLHARESSIFSGLSDLEEQEDSADEEDDNLFDELD